MIGKRVAGLCSSDEIFENCKQHYIDSLEVAGHKNVNWNYEELKSESQPKNQKRQRKRKIVWFNPPWCSSVKTKIGGTLFYLMEKHFPADHKLRKIINKNCVKVSYCCTSNMERIIKASNNNKLDKFLKN